MDEKRTYLAIDLKSFYASVECRARHLDPLTTNLVVADYQRTEKTICLAVSPSLRACGIPGRARLFEVIQKVREINSARRLRAPGGRFQGTSCDAEALRQDASLAVDYIIARPRMAHYIAYSAKIYEIYLRYIAPEDIYSYSVDEVFIDATQYLKMYRRNGVELAKLLMRAVFRETGIIATAGVGTNLYLCKVAMDILAKHATADADGMRVASLDEEGYRRLLWTHRPLTDFWRIGRGYAKKLEEYGLLTMGDIARCSVGDAASYYSEELLYRLFGVNAELLIDHAWGWECCTIEQIRAWRPSARSLCSGQVLQRPYTFSQARTVLREMLDALSLDLIDKKLCTDQLTLTIGFDTESLTDARKRAAYRGEVKIDPYGRRIPKHARGSANLTEFTDSARRITQAVLDVYDVIVDENLLIRRMTLSANHLREKRDLRAAFPGRQLDFLSALPEEQHGVTAMERSREARIQEAILNLKKRYGRNAVLKGFNLEEGATGVLRNAQIGGHRA
ncbi:MAG: DNA methylase [Ndongobacter sp.]|nr:DNA methylase [Ndongobacter sp.]